MPPKSHVEQVKEASRGLRGTLSEELAQPTPNFSKDSTHVLKFHGVYQQQDRDLRQESKQTGGAKAYQFMVRTKFPGGGRLSPEQWRQLDWLSDRWGNGTLRVTTRQDLQFHGVGKDHLKDLIQALDSIRVSTYGACGDGVRNTVACPLTCLGRHELGDYDAVEWAGKVSGHFAFRSKAYCEVWLDGEKLALEGEAEDEPIYGKTYLPRKFKIGFAHAGDNCSDVFTHDVGIVPTFSSGRLQAFQLLVGGGMGSSYGDHETHPRLGDPVAQVVPEDLLAAVETIVTIQGEHGNRSNRKQARLKYLMDQWGVERFREEMQRRLGRPLQPAGAVSVANKWDHHGWHRQRQEGLFYLGLSIPSGRITDTGAVLWKSGLRQIVSEFRPTVWLTPRQDLVLAGIAEAEIPAVNRRLKDFAIPLPAELAPLRLTTLACPAMPTCGLALGEAERILPSILNALETSGLAGRAVELRISGCPNGCSRTPVAELALIARGPNAFNVYVGGSATGNRLAFLLLDGVPTSQITAVTAELLAIHQHSGRSGEGFGDFSARLGAAGLRELMVGRQLVSA